MCRRPSLSTFLLSCRADSLPKKRKKKERVRLVYAAETEARYARRKRKWLLVYAKKIFFWFMQKGFSAKGFMRRAGSFVERAED